MDSNTREMLKEIRDRDGAISFLAARGVVVFWRYDGYSVEVDKEEYGWYPSVKALTEDLRELQDNRPFIKREWV